MATSASVRATCRKGLRTVVLWDFLYDLADCVYAVPSALNKEIVVPNENKYHSTLLQGI